MTLRISSLHVNVLFRPEIPSDLYHGESLATHVPFDAGQNVLYTQDVIV